MFDNMFSFVFDVDGTLCPIKGEDESYADLVPYADMVEKLREYKAQGARIILYTSRNMRTYGAIYPSSSSTPSPSWRLGSRSGTSRTTKSCTGSCGPVTRASMWTTGPSGPTSF